MELGAKKEGIGKETEDKIHVSFSYSKVFECNLVEEERKKLETLFLLFSPFKIKTLYFKV